MLLPRENWLLLFIFLLLFLQEKLWWEKKKQKNNWFLSVFSSEENGIEKKKGNKNNNVKRTRFFFPTLNMREYTSCCILHRFFPKNISVPASSSKLTCDLQQVTISMALGSTSSKPAITERFNGLHSLNLQSFLLSSR